MNKIFRLIWNIARQAWVVAAEKVSSKGGMPARTVGALCAVTLLAAGSAAYALPVGNTLVAGQATVTTPAAGQMQITQSTNRAIINWNSFGIAAGEAVNISQAALLNRVVGNSGSEIFGKLSANGQVFLINPNGVLFGRGAEVNVGGLVASSLNMTDDNFMNSNLTFFKDGAAGSVVNQGSITAGFAALLGPTVDNSGTIVTLKGSTALGAADAVTLDFDAQGLITLKLDQGAYGAQVQNSGVIEADGGRVLLTAKSADDILKSMVNTSGRIQARTVENRNGEILLLGDMQNGTVKVDGLLDASAPSGGNGGFIETSAAIVQVADSARVTTLAPQGNVGTWLIDPDGFTIAADGDMTGAAVGTALAGGNFSIASTGGSGSDGNINVNDTVSWSANKLTLTVTNDINVNAVMTASGTASLDLEPGSGKVNMRLSGSGFYGRVDFVGRSGLGFLTIGGNGYTVIGDDVNSLQGIGSGNYALGSNIDATATNSWNANVDDGGFYGFAPIMSYAGNFNGLGHTISSLTINRPGANYVGLFGVAVGAAISNVGLVGGSVSGSSQVGALVGLVSDSSIITNSYATGAVSGQWLYIGGLVGENNGSTISACFSTGSVSDATFFENSTQSIGGLVGRNSGSSIITNSYATGMVSGYYEVGGLVGKNDHSSIGNSYATGVVNGYNYVGGLVGKNDLSSIGNSYATGEVRPVISNRGGLVGGYFSGAGDISNSYWDTYTSTQNTSFGGIGLTTADMKNLGANSGWDTSIWKFYDGFSYPLLKSFLTPLTVTANSASKTYDGTAYSGVNGVVYSSVPDANLMGTVGYIDISQGAINAGSYSITPTGLYSNQKGYDITFVDGALTVNKAGLTVTGAATQNKIYDGTTAATITGATLSTVFGTDDVTVSGGGTFVDKNVADDIDVTAVLTLGGAAAGNYTVTQPVGLTANITKANAIVTANSDNKTYNGLSQSVNGFTATGLVNNETSAVLTDVTAGASGTNAGTYTATASGADGNYNLSFVNGALTINKAEATVTANSDSKTYNGLAYTGGNGVAYSGFVNGETVAVLGGSLAYGGTSQGAMDLGSYTIIPSGLTSSNYTIGYANGQLNIVEPPPVPTHQPGQMRDQVSSLLTSFNTSPFGQSDIHNLPILPPTAGEQGNGEQGPDNNLLLLLNGGIRL